VDHPGVLRHSRGFAVYGMALWFAVLVLGCFGPCTAGVVLLASGAMVRSSASRAFDLASEAIRHRAQIANEAEQTRSEDIKDNAA
jgi:hypothetical protein